MTINDEMLRAFRAITDDLDDPVVLMDIETLCPMLENPAASRVGVPGPATDGGVDRRASMESAFARQLRDSDPYRCWNGAAGEEVVITGDGGARTYHCHAHVVPMELSMVPHLVFTFSGNRITHGRACDCADTSACHCHHAGIGGSGGEFLWEVDTQGGLTRVSRNVDRILGIDRKRVIGTSIFDWVPGHAVTRVRGALAECAVHAQAWRGLRHPYLGAQGREGYLDLSGVPLLDAAGRLTGFRGFGRPIDPETEWTTQRPRFMGEGASAGTPKDGSAPMGSSR